MQASHIIIWIAASYPLIVAAVVWQARSSGVGLTPMEKWCGIVFLPLSLLFIAAPGLLGELVFLRQNSQPESDRKLEKRKREQLRPKLWISMVWIVVMTITFLPIVGFLTLRESR